MLVTALLHTSERVLQVHALAAKVQHCLATADLVLLAVKVETQGKSVTAVMAAQVMQVQQA